LTIIQIENGNIFGGFTNISWINDNKSWQEDEFSFIFSVRPKLKKFDIQNKSNAVYIASDYAPWFGNNDIIIWDDCDTIPSSYCKSKTLYWHRLHSCTRATNERLRGPKSFR